MTRGAQSNRTDVACTKADRREPVTIARRVSAAAEADGLAVVDQLIKPAQAVHTRLPHSGSSVGMGVRRRAKVR